jgi:hypothetical protein
MEPENEMVDQSALAGIGINQKDRISAELMAEIKDTLFSQDDWKLVQMTDLEKGELPSAYALEFLYHFVIKRHCYNPIVRSNLRKAINKVYQLRNSLKRQREQALIDIVKNENYVPFPQQQTGRKWF